MNVKMIYTNALEKETGWQGLGESSYKAKAAI